MIDERAGEFFRLSLSPEKPTMRLRLGIEEPLGHRIADFIPMGELNLLIGQTRHDKPPVTMTMPLAELLRIL